MINGTFLLLGGNLGDTISTFNKVKEHLDDQGIRVVEISSLYQTEAWGHKDQPDFINQVLQIDYNVSPEKLLDSALEIEKTLGRIRNNKWGPRIIDIDILYIDQRIINQENLKVPHPAIQDRKFSLMPMVEIAGEFIHPVLQKSQHWLLAHCNDKLHVKKL